MLDALMFVTDYMNCKESQNMTHTSLMHLLSLTCRKGGQRSVNSPVGGKTGYKKWTQRNSKTPGMKKSSNTKKNPKKQTKENPRIAAFIIPLWSNPGRGLFQQTLCGP